MKKSQIIGGVVIVAFLALGASAFKGAATRYVTFAEARRSPAVVQVKGTVEKGSIQIDPKTLALRFEMVDEAGERLPVTYVGAEPGGLRQAPSVVAVGRVNGSVFEAQTLLVKCPSKYEGVAEAHPEGTPAGKPEAE